MKQIKSLIGIPMALVFSIQTFLLTSKYLFLLLLSCWPLLMEASTIWVTNRNAGNVTGSLYRAILQANSGDIIKFDVDGPVHVGSSLHSSLIQGRIHLSKNLTFIGPVTLSGVQTQVLFFDVQSEVSLTFEQITFEHATGYYTYNQSSAHKNPFAGGVLHIKSGANVSLQDCHFNNNSSEKEGGAIYNAGILSLSGCTFSDNIAIDSVLGYGGAIYNIGSISMDQCHFGTLAPNKSRYEGGAIYNAGTAFLQLSECSFFENQSEEKGGGAIHSANASGFQINKCTFSQNQAYGPGGALSIEGPCNIDASTFDHNSSPSSGGAIANGQSSVLVMVNSSISNNHSDSTGGGLLNHGSMSLTNCTLTENHAESMGGGIHNAGAGNLEMVNTIVAGNSTNGNSPDIRSFIPTIFQSYGYNLIGILEGANLSSQTSDLLGSSNQPIDALLDKLSFNGGPTATHALLSGSPAIDQGDLAQSPPEDQRGVIRSGKADIGAFEGEIAASISSVSYSDISIFVYPNPTSDYITLSIEQSIPRNLNVALMDLSGRIHRIQSLPNGERSISEDLTQWISPLPIGTYHLVVSEGDQTIHSVRFIRR